MEITIISLALLVFMAHVFAAMFVKTRLPDVLPLMLLGIIIGPVFQIVSPADFGMVDKVFTRVLLIVILFESGLGIKISQIRLTWTQSLRLTLACFTVMTAVIAALARFALGLPSVYAFALGCILASNSFAVIIPLISKLNISANIKTVLLSESTLGSVLSIAGAVTILQMPQIDTFGFGRIGAKIIYMFLLSFAVGAGAAIFWTMVLHRIRKLENSIFLTPAFVMIVYSVCEACGADGAISAFIFGIIAGNIRVIRSFKALRFIGKLTRDTASNAFNEVEKSFFGEIVFLLRTFFFVYIGICMHIGSRHSMLYGLLFTAVIFITRAVVANLTLAKSVSRLDAAAASAMAPKGLVTAVLASLAAQSGAGALQDIVYSVIFFSILFATLMSFCIEKGYCAGIVAFVFRRHQEAAAPSERNNHAGL
ncbi:MAG: cation:proton antiporter [Elusimicrobiota bacterium]|jgi:NhaP-type Na+/H+ or K+/H+ antiporter|nr:cation:proton antiporter [Elusimicrobiota bacterium]